jgi:hypothetical protein
MSQQWRNRIVSSGVERPDQLLANPKNWRVHPQYQQNALKGVLDEIGWIQDVVVNRATGHIIDGHMRVSIALQRDEEEIPVKYVDLSPAEEELALATFDPIGALAITDKDALQGLIGELDTTNTAITDMLEATVTGRSLQDIIDEAAANLAENPYAHKVETPIYTPTGEEPPIESLTDTTRRDSLVAAIESSTVPEQVKRFLRSAAERHVVFKYKLIAEFYAHADAQTQRLMEDSALVIVDFNRAIELGYVNLHETMLTLTEEARHGG